MDYKGRRWQRVRREVLARDRFLCRECARYGKTTEANTVHHVFPVEDWPGREWERWNMIALCLQCHDAMHDRFTRQLTAKGLAWCRRVSPHPPRG